MAEKSSNNRVFYGWINLMVVGVIGIIGGFYIASFSYFIDPLIEEFGWKYGIINLASTISMLALGFCGPLAGIFIMKFGARRAIFVGNFLGFSGFFILYFLSHLWQLYLGFGLLIGTAGGLGGMLATTTVINTWFVKKRSVALGLFLAIGGFGGMGMGPAIQASINAYGWRHTFLFISLLVLVFAIIVPAIFIRNRPEEVGQVSDGAQGLDDTADTRKPMPIKAAYKTPVDFTAKEAMRTRCFWLLVVYYSMNMLAMNAVMVPQMPHLNDIGVNNIVGAFALSIMVGVMSFSQFGTGFIGMKFSMHSIAICAEIIKAIGLIILVTTRSLPFVFVYMVFLGLGFGAFIVAMMNILPNYFGAKYYPKIMGNARLFFAIIGSAGAPIAGHIKDITDSFIPAFQGAVVIIIVGIIFLALAKPPVHPSLRKSHQTNSPTV